MRSFPCQSILLIASLILAVFFAVGGWTLGRWRSLRQANVTKSALAPIKPKVTIVAIAVPNASGAIVLGPAGATLQGGISRSIVAGDDGIVGWTSAQDTATWQFRANKPGFYSAELTYAIGDAAAEAELEVRMDDRKRLCSLRASGGLEQFITDDYPVAIATSGVHQLTIRPRSELPGAWLVLRSIRIIPTTPDKPAGGP
jgi:hypothetical protein